MRSENQIITEDGRHYVKTSLGWHQVVQTAQAELPEDGARWQRLMRALEIPEEELGEFVKFVSVNIEEVKP